jgi:DNA-binding NarL/FixJ family response regulator
MSSIRVLIADDNEEILAHFQGLLSREADIEIVGMARSGAEAVRLALSSVPDIVVMDIEMESQCDGIDAIREIKSKAPGIKIVVLTIHREDEFLFKAYSAGAMDFLVKTMPADAIVGSLRSVYANRLGMRPEIAEKIIAEFSRLRNEREGMLSSLDIILKLTNSELEIIKAVYQGGSYAEIAASRHVEKGTVKTQINRILKKFGKRRMSDVIRLLEERDIIRQLKLDAED